MKLANGPDGLVAWMSTVGTFFIGYTPIRAVPPQSITATANLPSVLAARSAALVVATPLGTALGGPLVAGLGAGWTITASGAATVVLAAVGQFRQHAQRLRLAAFRDRECRRIDAHRNHRRF